MQKDKLEERIQWRSYNHQSTIRDRVMQNANFARGFNGDALTRHRTSLLIKWGLASDWVSRERLDHQPLQ